MRRVGEQERETGSEWSRRREDEERGRVGEEYRRRRGRR